MCMCCCARVSVSFCSCIVTLVMNTEPSSDMHTSQNRNQHTKNIETHIGICKHTTHKHIGLSSQENTTIGLKSWSCTRTMWTTPRLSCCADEPSPKGPGMDSDAHTHACMCKHTYTVHVRGRRTSTDRNDPSVETFLWWDEQARTVTTRTLETRRLN